MKAKKTYKVTATVNLLYSGKTRTYEQTGTLEELIQAYSYTLEVGQSWEHEKGNKKINRNPKNIKALCDNLYKAKNNAASNGYSGYSYNWEEISE